VTTKELCIDRQAKGRLAISSIEHGSLHLLVIHPLISIQFQRLGWQEQEPCHVTDKALELCILGKFLGVDCLCFLPPLYVPTFAARCQYICKDARDPTSKCWKCGRVIVRQFCLNSDFH